MEVRFSSTLLQLLQFFFYLKSLANSCSDSSAEINRCVVFADGRSQYAECHAVCGWICRQRDDHRVQGAGHVNRWSLVATQDPIKKDGRADLFLDPPCRANLLHRDRANIYIHRL